MRRWHLFEIEDQPWLPATLRDLLTDFLQFMSTRLAIYRPVIPLLDDLFDRIRCRQVIDLCTGAAGPWPRLLDELPDVAVTLTDKYPNRAAMVQARRRHPEQITVCTTPVDARALPESFTGVCTLFNGFHHFRPAEAQAILQAVAHRRMAVAIFEIAEASPRIVLAVLFGVPLLVLIVTPWIRPLTFSRLFWTYIIPLVPLCLIWDGLVSIGRTYSRRDLQQLAAATDSPGYLWQTGRLAPPFPGVPVTYLIGYPQAQAQRRPQEAAAAPQPAAADRRTAADVVSAADPADAAADPVPPDRESA